MNNIRARISAAGWCSLIGTVIGMLTAIGEAIVDWSRFGLNPKDGVISFFLGIFFIWALGAIGYVLGACIGFVFGSRAFSAPARSDMSPAFTAATSSGVPSFTMTRARWTLVRPTFISFAASASKGPVGLLLLSPPCFSVAIFSATNAAWAIVSCRRSRFNETT